MGVAERVPAGDARRLRTWRHATVYFEEVHYNPVLTWSRRQDLRSALSAVGDMAATLRMQAEARATT